MTADKLCSEAAAAASVYGQAVRRILGQPKPFWLDLHGALPTSNQTLHRELTALPQAADLSATVSALSVCDVVSGCITVRII